MLVNEAFVDSMQPLLPTWIFGVEGLTAQARLFEKLFTLAGEQPQLAPMAGGVLYWAWQHHPLEKHLLAMLLQADQAMNLLPEPSKVFARTLNKVLLTPPDPDQAPDLLPDPAIDGPEALAGFVLEAAADEQLGLFWLGQGFEALLDAGLFEPADELLAMFRGNTFLQPLLQRLQAELAWCAHGPDQTRELVERIPPDLFGWWRQQRLGCAAQKAGDREQAIALYAALWRSIPWHTNLTLCLHDLVAPPVPAGRELPPGHERSAILLYSWNKQDEVLKTLHSAVASDIGKASVLALNNGSSDETLQAMRNAADLWRSSQPQSHFEIIDLPINIGAPAARNWLLAHPSVRQSEFAVFLDDDVRLPANWLRSLLSVAKMYPDAGSVGCRIVGGAKPHLMQSADLHAIPPELCDSSYKDFEENIFLFDNCSGQRDAGLFDYTRPCVSVTGCCHLLRRQALDAAGDFDLRFSPTQFDDLEHDLRAFLHGFPCVYHGQLRVEHAQTSSWRQAASTAKQGHIHGNKLKLEHLYNREQVRRIVGRNLALLREDLKRKLRVLHGLDNG